MPTLIRRANAPAACARATAERASRQARRLQAAELFTQGNGWRGGCKGQLYQPVSVHDPSTGQWRGATDQEYARWLAEMES